MSLVRSRKRVRAFSLLEVMVAVSILGLALTVILSAQGGLAASNKMAANMGMSTTLARCKMTELEEKLIKFGYPEIDQIDAQMQCCEGVEAPNFLCDTRVEKIMLPNPPDNSLGDGGFMASPAGSNLAGLAGLPGANPAGSSAALNLDVDSGLQNIGSQIQGQLAAVGGQGGLMSMVMGIVYPSLKPMMENSIRRLTVSVKWKEGSSPKEFAIVQYVTNPQRSGFLPGMDGGEAPIGSTPGQTPGVTAPPGLPLNPGRQ